MRKTICKVSKTNKSIGWIRPYWQTGMFSIAHLKLCHWKFQNKTWRHHQESGTLLLFTCPSSLSTQELPEGCCHMWGNEISKGLLTYELKRKTDVYKMVPQSEGVPVDPSTWSCVRSLGQTFHSGEMKP